MRSVPGAATRWRAVSAARKRTLLVTAVSVAVVAGAVVGWQVRAAQAEERREQSEARAVDTDPLEREAAVATTTPQPSTPSTPQPTPRPPPSPSERRAPAPTATPSPVPVPVPVAPAAPAARPAGAGPDCGGPGSYEPPVDDGRPIFYTSTPATTGNGTNGRIPASAMAPLDWCEDSQGNKQWLRADAATALTDLNGAFRAQFGENIAVDLSYRSYDQQVAMRDYYGSLAAKPGTSNHGLGTAIDTWEWAAYAFGSARYDWLVLHAPEHGWSAPAWARSDGSTPEYWHFEYAG